MQETLESQRKTIGWLVVALIVSIYVSLLTISMFKGRDETYRTCAKDLHESAEVVMDQQQYIRWLLNANYD